MHDTNSIAKIIQDVPKKVTKVVGYNFACVGSFLMKFWYVTDIGYKFFHKKFQGPNSKNDRLIKEKLILQCLLRFDAYNSACESQKCTKILGDVAQLSVKRSWKFH